MYSKIVDNKTPTRILFYPCLKEFKEENRKYIVLFTSSRTGTVIYSDVKGIELGFTSNSFMEEQFIESFQSVLLSNQF